jgi:hypothetical protein
MDLEFSKDVSDEQIRKTPYLATRNWHKLLDWMFQEEPEALRLHFQNGELFDRLAKKVQILWSYSAGLQRRGMSSQNADMRMLGDLLPDQRELPEEEQVKILGEPLFNQIKGWGQEISDRNEEMFLTT